MGAWFLAPIFRKNDERRHTTMEEKHILSLAEKLKSLKDTKSALDAELKSVSADIETLMRDLSDLMAEQEMPSFSHSGFTYSLTTRRYASPSDEEEGGREALYAALRKNGCDHLFTVNPQTLTGFVKEQAEEYAEEHDGKIGLPGWLEGKVRLYDKVSVTVRKAAKK
jgi:hypothetical protein